MEKKIFKRAELVAMGYPDMELRKIARGEDAHLVGFHGTRGEGTANKFYFDINKLDQYLEKREKIR